MDGESVKQGGTISDLNPKHGGYRKLKSFQVAQLVYDVTVRFCDKYIDRFSRTKVYPELSANAALVLLAVACSLLDRQVERLAQDFESEGGFTERLYRVRTGKRRSQRP